MNAKAQKHFLKILILVLISTLVAAQSSNSDNIKFPNIGDSNTNRLLLWGCFRVSDNAVDTVRLILMEKINLPELEYRIVQAKFLDKGLLFEMRCEGDVQTILDNAAVLKKGNCFLERTTAPFIDLVVK
ncbi:uncharacterized protein LOC142225394 [Haematobia irritans]|uniref:uncharacterized protein LOC142225394 n=1 Tax=Haematobia irritans TaxID=7368 RepID=UPI003F4F4DC0